MKAITYCLFYAAYWIGDHASALIVSWIALSLMSGFAMAALIRWGRRVVF